ncbi:hypothetical protein D9619_012927 [Psilocybe cf. subviscida]|uniref:Uncharacterized protein n=1 Tax=Psilocybe cf. subviscida TaxID=2480587 RepID=A0A8H5F5A3_9AGAR|nr:hypothetical protein D9619_012927 [Psilocybe cf. subviscida]
MSPTLALLVPEKQLQYVDDSIENQRNLVSLNPVFHGRRLIALLHRKAALLYSINKGQESADVCQEAAILAQQFLRDDQLYATALRRLGRQFRLLGRYNDAANTGMLVVKRQGSSDIQVSVYYKLCFDLFNAGRIEEALQAAEKSVLSGRILALKDAARCTVDLLRSLHCLALCLFATGKQDGALQTGREILRIMDKLIMLNSPLLQEHNLLDYISIFALLPDDEQQSLAFMSDIRSLFQKLAECNPENREIVSHLLWCQHRQAENFFQHNHPLKAKSYIEKLLHAWEARRPNLSVEHLATLNIATLNIHAEVLHNVGQSKQALDTLYKAVVLAQPYLSSSETLWEMILSTHCRIVITTSLRNEYSSEMQQIAEDVLKLAQETPGTRNEGLVSSLHSVCIAACHNKMYQRLVEASKESLDACRGDNEISFRRFLEDISPLDPSLAFLPKSMQLLSFGLANLGRMAEGIQYAKEAVECSINLKMTATVASSVSAQSYIETRGNLANILIANGDLDEAVHILKERRDYFSNRVEVRNGEYRDLVPTIRTLGILLCHLGCHEEGKAAVREFQRIMQTLSTVFSSLHSQVIVHLKRDIETPILQPLEDMHNNLNCNHQQEISIA